MNRMIGLGEALTSSITCLSRFSNSPFTPAPGLEQAEVERAQRDVLERRGDVARRDPQGEALDDGRLADARPRR